MIQTIHLSTMLALAVSAMVRWGIHGNIVLSTNWHAAQPSSAVDVAKQIFFGVSIGFLAYTGLALKKRKTLMIGFELTPSYVEDVRPGAFPKVLRNLWIMSFSQLTLMMLLVWAVVPYPEIQSYPNNILSILAQQAVGGKWLRYIVVTDAVLVLCASIFTVGTTSDS